MASELLQQRQFDYLTALQQLRAAENLVASAEQADAVDAVALLHGRNAAAEQVVHALRSVYDAVPEQYPASFVIAHDPILPASRTLSSELGDVSARVRSTEGAVPGRAACLEVLQPVVLRQTHTLVPLDTVGESGSTTAALVFQDMSGNSLASIHASSLRRHLEVTAETAVFSNDIYVTGRATMDDMQMHSDRRLKTDIEGLDREASLDVVRQLRPVSFRYLQTRRGACADEAGPTDQRYGFVAQEVQQVLPSAVGVDGSHHFHTLRSLDMVAHLFAAVQRLDERLLEVEDELRRLKS